MHRISEKLVFVKSRLIIFHFSKSLFHVRTHVMWFGNNPPGQSKPTYGPIQTGFPCVQPAQSTNVLLRRFSETFDFHAPFSMSFSKLTFYSKLHSVAKFSCILKVHRDVTFDFLRPKSRSLFHQKKTGFYDFHFLFPASLLPFLGILYGPSLAKYDD